MSYTEIQKTTHNLLCTTLWVSVVLFSDLVHAHCMQNTQKPEKNNLWVSLYIYKCLVTLSL